MNIDINSLPPDQREQFNEVFVEVDDRYISLKRMTLFEKLYYVDKKLNFITFGLAQDLERKGHSEAEIFRAIKKLMQDKGDLIDGVLERLKTSKGKKIDKNSIHH